MKHYESSVTIDACADRVWEALPDTGGTSLSMREEFSGPMLGMIGKKMPDLQPSFDQFTAALKAEAERD